MKLLILHVLFVVSVNSNEPPVRNNHIGNCSFGEVSNADAQYTQDGDRITFECVPSFQSNDYFNSSTSITCPNFGGETVSKHQIVQMDFDNCSMSTIGFTIFEVYTEISILNVSYLGIETLQPELFQSADKLTKLNVSHNNISEVKKFLFAKTKKLVELDFSFNTINRIDSHTFAGDSKVKRLNLSNNSIKYLSEELFDHLLRLEHLDLSNNAIDDLEENTFNSLTNLQSLDLSYNPIQELNKKTFDSLTKLRHLYLSHMNLETIEPKTFCRQEQLEVLDLSYNRLKVLDIRAFDGAIFLPRIDNLKHLLIGNNQLNELNGFSSSRFPNVKITGIDQNEFDCCYLEELLRSIDRKQLDLSFDENTNHPNLSDSMGVKCEFGSNFIYDDREEPDSNWTGTLIIICMLLLTAIFVLTILIVRGKQTHERTETTKNQCARHFNDSVGNVYDVPKF